MWNVNVADREGEYPALGLLLLAVGSVMALGVVGMWNEEAKTEQASRELTAATGNFSSLTIIRSYENSDAGLRQANADAATLARQGYVPAGQAADGAHQPGTDRNGRRAHRGNQPAIRRQQDEGAGNDYLLQAPIVRRRGAVH